MTNYSVRDLQVLQSPTREWVYGKEGGQQVVLVHGFRGDHHGLAAIAAKLVKITAGSLSVHVPDLPGFGSTPALAGREHDLALYGQWLKEFVLQSCPGQVTVIGHSFGSLVVSAALAAGLGCERVILINPIAAPALQGPQALLTKLAIVYYRLAALLPDRWARALLSNQLLVRFMSEVMAKTKDPALRRLIHAQHRQFFSTFSDPQTLLAAFRASVSHTVAEFAAFFTAPTLLIAGDLDDITPLAKQLALQKLLPQAQLRVLRGSGHLVHYEKVTPASALIAEFISGQFGKLRAH